MYKRMLAEYTSSQMHRLTTLPFAEAIGYWNSVNSILPLAPRAQEDRIYKFKLTERIIEHCPEEIKSKTLTQIKYNDLVVMYNILEKEQSFSKVGKTTRVKWRKFITSIYSNLLATGVVNTLPTIGWAPEKADSVPTSLPEKSVLIKALRKQPTNFIEASNRALIAIGLETGIRLSSIVKLTLDNFVYGYTETGEKIIRKLKIVGAKHNANYECPVGYEASKIILDYIQNYRPADFPHRNLFITTIGTPLTIRCAADRLAEMCIREGYNHLTAHQFRVMFATNLANKTKDIGVIRQALGVSSYSAALHYVRKAEEVSKAKIIQENSLVEEYLSVSNDEASIAQASVDSAVNENSCNTPHSEISDAQNSPKENLVSGSHLDTLVVDNYPKENQVSSNATQFSAMVNMVQQMPPEVASKFYAMMVEQVNSVMMSGMSNLMVPNSSNHQFVKPTFVPKNHHPQSLSAQMRMQ